MVNGYRIRLVRKYTDRIKFLSENVYISNILNAKTSVVFDVSTSRAIETIVENGYSSKYVDSTKG